MASVTKIPQNPQGKKGSSLWLQQMIDGCDAPHIETLELTPDLAKTLLGLNPNNRPVRKAKVAQYASDMATGRWALNGEPIIVSADGYLNDGQHRCLAVIDANAAVPVLVMFGIARETRLTLDTGGARGAGDFLNMEGIANGALVAAIARMVIAYENGERRSLSGDGRVSSSEIRERVYRDAALGISATFGHTNHHYARNFAAGSLIGFAHYVLGSIDRADAETFLSRVCRGDGLRMGDPAHTLREKLISGGKLPRDRKIKLFFQAWNFHRRGMRVRAASMDSTPPLPALF